MEIENFLGDRIKRRRLELLLSQSDLADFTGIAQSTISAYESGRMQPSKKALAKLAEALCIKESYLTRVIEYTPTQKEFLELLENKKETIDLEEIKENNIQLLIDGKEATDDEIKNAISIIIGMREYKKRS